MLFGDQRCKRESYTAGPITKVNGRLNLPAVSRSLPVTIL